jgi:quercetin dioxygenase-like cupin family protein
VADKTKQTVEDLNGEWLQATPGERFLIRIPAAATGGSYSVTEIVASPGDSTPVHVHQNEDEYLLVVEGTARILCGVNAFAAPAGTMGSLPRHVPHAWGNPTDTPIRVVVTAAPGGCEEALRLIATAGDQLDLQAIAKKFAVTAVGPPLLGRIGFVETN